LRRRAFLATLANISFSLAPLVMRLITVVVCCFTGLVLVGNAPAQPYGLSSRPAVGPFLDDVMPESAPTISGNWSAVVAFTNLTFTNAIGLTYIPGTSKLVVWEREGRIWSFTNHTSANSKTLVLDISSQCQGWDDSGLLNLAFHPAFATNRYFYVYYTWVTPGTVEGGPTTHPTEYVPGKYHDRLSRFTLDAAGIALPGSELVLVDQAGDSAWHNGSGFFFHPVNGFLYWTDGDDERSPAQVIDQKLFAGVFRIDVDMRGGSISHPIPRQPQNGVTGNYYIPNSNPFVGQTGVLEEFYALGLRSPHRMTYDTVSDRIFIADVGAGAREELDIIEPTDPAGLNFQWSVIEGLNGDLTLPYLGVNKRPVLDYDHSSGDGYAIIGGHVYRGGEFAADLGGKYIFGDNVTRNIWALNEATVPPSKILLCVMPAGTGPTSQANYLGLSSFGEDQNHELYFCQMSNEGGRIYKFARSGPPPASRPMPALLSETGVFQDLATLTPSPKLVPYTVNSPLWSDAALKQRWMALPTGTQIQFSPTGEWSFPNGSVFVKHFTLQTNENNPSLLRRLETRLLVRDTNGAAYGVTYKWRPDNSDADLLTNSVSENILITTTTGTRTQQWYYPSRSDCLRCHTPAASFVLGVKTRQLTGNFAYPSTGVTDVQLRAWNHVGLFDVSLNEAAIPDYDKLVSISDTSADLEMRVRSYLDANCSQCHRPGGVRAVWDARYNTPLASQGIINGTVVDSLGITRAKVVAPQDLSRSIMYLRLNSLDTHKMPPLARNMIDTNAVTTLATWINSIPATNGLPAPARGSYAELLLAYGPIGYWRFQESAAIPPIAYDYTSGNDLINANVGSTAGPLLPGFETTNRAARYNGSNARSQTGGSLMNGLTRFTLCGWFKADSMPQPTRTALFGQNDVAEFGFHSSVYGIWIANNATALLPGNISLSPNTWYFAVATVDDTSLKLYLNATLVASQLTSFSGYSSADPFSVGAAVLDSTGNYFAGGIDEVALFDKALTALQIRTLYSSATNGPAQLGIQQFDNPVVLTWPYGTLQSSELPQGIYTNVPGALSPYTNAIDSQRKFFRLRID